VNPPTRCALYGRFSTEKQSAISIEQQFRKCREYADRHGLHVLEEHLYSDEAISGATAIRPGLQRLLEASRMTQRPFDVILVDDTSRLSRNLRDALKIFDDLKFYGVGAIFVSTGLDTRTEDAELRFQMAGMFDAKALKEMSLRTWRGVEHLALNGYHTGGRVFGYRHIRELHPTAVDAYGDRVVVGVKLEVDPQQAATIKRIFERYASGHSLKRVARELNLDGVSSPQPQKGRVSRTWCPSSVRHILHNERYRGVVCWGMTKKVRCSNGKRIYRKKPRSEWRIKEIPAQRIVSEELFEAVKKRIAMVNSLYHIEGVRPGLLRARAAVSPHIFTGLLTCALCGGSVTIVSGSRGSRGPRYGCSLHSTRGDGVCTNNLLWPSQALENQLLKGLQDRVMHQDVVDYTLKRFEGELEKALQDKSADREVDRRVMRKLESEIANLTRALADGYSQAVTGRLFDLELQLSGISSRVAAAQPSALKMRMRDTRKFVLSRLRDLGALLNSEAQVARAEIAKHVGKITLRPRAGRYEASGNWNWMGVAVWMVPEARIELATPAFSGRRSTTELLRQRSIKCRGAGKLCQ
jgi:site-specific DNA recombinase